MRSARKQSRFLEKSFARANAAEVMLRLSESGSAAFCWRDPTTRSPKDCSLITGHFARLSYGRGAGVGRGLGSGMDLGVGLGRGVVVGVAVGVAVAVAVGVGVAVGVAPPAGAWIATVIGEPVLKKPTVALVSCGGWSASKRKLYNVPQRIAFAF